MARNLYQRLEFQAKCFNGSGRNSTEAYELQLGSGCFSKKGYFGKCILRLLGI